MLKNRIGVGVILVVTVIGLLACAQENQGGGTGGAGTQEQQQSVTPSEQAVFMAASETVFQDLAQDPSQIQKIASEPFASYILTQQKGYEQWAGKNQEQAKRINESAQKWQQMSQQERDAFINQNPNLKRMMQQGGGSSGGSSGSESEQGNPGGDMQGGEY